MFDQKAEGDADKAECSGRGPSVWISQVQNMGALKLLEPLHQKSHNCNGQINEI